MSKQCGSVLPEWMGPWAGRFWANVPIPVYQLYRKIEQERQQGRKAAQKTGVTKAMKELEDMTQAYLDRAERYKEAYPEGYTGEL